MLARVYNARPCARAYVCARFYLLTLNTLNVLNSLYACACAGRACVCHARPRVV